MRILQQPLRHTATDPVWASVLRERHVVTGTFCISTALLRSPRNRSHHVFRRKQSVFWFCVLRSLSKHKPGRPDNRKHLLPIHHPIWERVVGSKVTACPPPPGSGVKDVAPRPPPTLPERTSGRRRDAPSVCSPLSLPPPSPSVCPDGRE